MVYVLKALIRCTAGGPAGDVSARRTSPSPWPGRDVVRFGPDRAAGPWSLSTRRSRWRCCGRGWRPRRRSAHRRGRCGARAARPTRAARRRTMKHRVPPSRAPQVAGGGVPNRRNPGAGGTLARDLRGPEPRFCVGEPLIAARRRRHALIWSLDPGLRAAAGGAEARPARRLARAWPALRPCRPTPDRGGRSARHELLQPLTVGVRGVDGALRVHDHSVDPVELPGAEPL